MSQTVKTSLGVQGMSCPSCIRHVRDALGELDGVESVEVRLREGRVLVEHDPQTNPVERLTDALRDAGYQSRANGAEGEPGRTA
jgi:copper chaperone